MIVFCNIIIVVMIYYAFIMIKMKKLQQEVERKVISKIQMEDFHKTIQMKFDVKMQLGKYYGYNPRKKSILYPDKENYSSYDIFAIYHELGHYRDDIPNDNIFKHMRITCINRLIISPCTFLGMFICDYWRGYAVWSNLFILLVCMFYLLGLHQIYFIYKYENSASNFAIDCMSYLEEDKMRIKELAFLAIRSQYVFVSIFLLMGILVIYNFLV